MTGLRYLLDTDICIYVIKRHPVTVARRIAALPDGTLGMSVVTYGELWRGVERSQHRERNLDALHQLTAVITVQPLPADAGRIYGDIRTRLERTGTPIGGNDLWIAAHALAADLTLVTNNGREFSRIEDLRLENWTN
jgi:tRNA(fMet)-specific endonuclease VapC